MAELRIYACLNGKTAECYFLLQIRMWNMKFRIAGWFLNESREIWTTDIWTLLIFDFSYRP